MNSNELPWFGAASAPDAPQQPDASAQMPLLLRYWRVLVRRRWLVFGVTAATIVLGLVITMLITPTYTASSSLEISRQQDRVVKMDDVEPESSFVDQEFYQTQYSLLEARSLAEAVAAELRLPQDDEFFEMFGVDPSGEGLFSAETTGQLTREQRAVRQREAVKILLDNVGISPTRGSRIVTVSFSSPDPVFSARVVNSWTKNFISQTLARRYEANSYARNFLEERLDQLRNRLEDSERALVGYAENQQIINVPTGNTAANGSEIERPLVAEDLAALNDALAEAEADRIAAASRAGSESGVSREALTNTAITGMRQDRAETAAEYARLLAQFQPDYPPVEALAAKLQQLDASIATEEARISRSLGSDYVSATRREGQLRQRVNELKSQLLDQRRRSIQYNIYQREADTNRELYNGLLQRYKEIGVAGGVGSNNISIIDGAQPPEKPSSPRLALNLFLALVGGLGIGVGIAFLLEQIDEAIREPSVVKEITGLPLLGVIPVVEDDGDPKAALIDPKSPQSEAYLSVRTNLQFATDHGVPRSLTVTSTRASEGKSTSAMALAQSIARTGQKVVLVDCDMRSPSIHHAFGRDNAVGVSNFLSGNDDVDALIWQADPSGISCMSAGPQPPNAGELLASNRLRQLLDALEKRFDYVVIDSPPVLGLADAIIIASQVEGLIFAIEANAARRSAIRTAILRLQQTGIQPIGVLLTKFEARKAQYGYGYDYGYGYGAEKRPA